MEVTIVNRYYPPSKVVIAESAADLARYLMAKGIHVKVVYTTAKYKGVGAEGEPIGELHTIRSIYDGENKIFRLLSSFIESYRLIKKALTVSMGPIIIMTAPGFLGFWASKLFGKQQKKWLYWTMDLFPEAFVAANLVKPKNPIYKYIKKVTYSYPPMTLIALGRIQADYVQQQFHKDIPTVVLPCGVLLDQQTTTETPDEKPSWKGSPDKIYFGYVGNMGQAHSAEFVLHFIKTIDPEKHRLILVVYGNNAHVIKQYLADNPTEGVLLLDYIPREKLRHIDVHLVSLKSEFVNVCVPSKLVSAVHQSSLFLFHGIRECDNWDYLQTAGWLIEEGEHMTAQIESFLNTISKDKINEKRATASHMPGQLYNDVVKAYEKIATTLREETML